MTSTHIAIASISKGHFDAIEVPTESPGKGEVLLKVSHAAMIAFDTYVADARFPGQEYPMILGFSCAGTVHQVGTGVKDLKVHDRVTAYAYQKSRNKGLQQYAIEPSTVCAKIPDNLSFEQAATIPDNFVTAFYSLFGQMSLPLPKSFPALEAPPLAKQPIMISGAGSSAGLYTVQLLHLAGYRNIIATASPNNHAYIRSLGASHVFDYRSPTIVEDIAQVVGGDGKVPLALDCILAETTVALMAKVISPAGLLAILYPYKEGSKVTGRPEEQMFFGIPEDKNPLPRTTKIVGVRTFFYQENEYLKRNLMPTILPALLEKALIKPNPVHLIDQGSFKDRVGTGLELLRSNQISGRKVVVKVDDVDA